MSDEELLPPETTPEPEPEKPGRGRPPMPARPESDEDRMNRLRFHPLFVVLTPGQQRFVMSYIHAGGDAVKAAYEAYHPGSDRAARDMGTRYLRMFAIRRAIAAYDGLDAMVTPDSPLTRAEFLCLLAARMRKPKLADSTFAAYAKILLEARNWRIDTRRKIKHPTAPAEPAEPEEEIDEIDELVKKIEQEKRRLNGQRDAGEAESE